MKSNLNYILAVAALTAGLLSAVVPIVDGRESDLSARPCEYDCAVNYWNGGFYCYPGGEWTCPLYERPSRPME